MKPRRANHSSVTSLLMLGVLAATLLYSLVFVYIASTQFQATADRLRARLLTDQAGLIAALLDTGKRDEPLAGGSFYQYVMRDAATGRIVSRSADADLAVFPAAAANGETFSFDGPHGRHVRGAGIRVGDRFVQIAQDENSMRGFSDMLGQSMLARLSLFGIPFLALLMLVVAMSVKLIMLPIAKALKQLGQVSFDRPELRLDIDGFPSELQPLATAINGALGRVGRGVEAQKDFVANAAHELRTPLAVLRAHLETMDGDAMNKDGALQMRQDVDAMARLVGQLLDTARLDAPEKPELQRLDLTVIARDAAQNIWPLVITRGRTLDVRGMDAPAPVMGNADMLGRAVRNLLENALHHTPPGSRVELSVEPGAIIVRDHGPGIADARKAAIFERFSRGDSQAGGGAGLGLFIVRQVMKLHDGIVHVEDAEGGGARFCLIFKEKLDKNSEL